MCFRSIHLFLPLLERGQFHAYLTAQAQNAVPRISAFLTYWTYQNLNALLSTITASIYCCYGWNWLLFHVKAMNYHSTVWRTQHGFYIKYQLHLSMLFTFWAWKHLLVTRIISFFLSENRRKWQFCWIQGPFTEFAQLLIIGLDKGIQKRPLFKHFFCFCYWSSLYQLTIWNSKATSCGKNSWT